MVKAVWDERIIYSL